MKIGTFSLQLYSAPPRFVWYRSGLEGDWTMYSSFGYGVQNLKTVLSYCVDYFKVTDNKSNR